MQPLPSRLMQKCVDEFSKLPGIGSKSALRLALHLLKQSPESVAQLSAAIQTMRQEITYCHTCFNISDTTQCSICTDAHRNAHLICVVESVKEVIAIENTNQFRGMYHVLGGVLSPIDGIGPESLHIDSLIERIKAQAVTEILMALSPTMEGDTTMYYLSKKIEPLLVKITSISRGIAIGAELEYTDELTLARAIFNRQPYEQFLTQK